jgi:DNA polymerase III alpha chain
MEKELEDCKNELSKIGFAISSCRFTDFESKMILSISKEKETADFSSLFDTAINARMSIISKTNIESVLFFFTSSGLNEDEKAKAFSTFCSLLSSGTKQCSDNQNKVTISSENDLPENERKSIETAIEAELVELHLKRKIEFVVSEKAAKREMAQIDVLIQSKKPENGKYAKGKDSEYKRVKIADIPSTKEGLDSFFEDKIEVLGTIFQIENRKTGTSYLYEIYIYDGTDSIEIKEFVKPSKIEKFASLNIGDKIIVRGYPKYDEFSGEVVVSAFDVENIGVYSKQEDESFDDENKRAELNVHTKYSAMDGIASPEDIFAVAKKNGMDAVAIVDNDDVQAFPEAFKAAKKTKVKAIYGAELRVRDDSENKIANAGDNPFSDDIVGLDIETTGFSAVYDNMIEVSACKIGKDGSQEEMDFFVQLEDPSSLTPQITELTGISLNEINSGIPQKEAIEKLIDFIGKGTVVAHNAFFDVGFIEEKARQLLGINIRLTFIDTLNMSRAMLADEMKRFGLANVCKKLGVELTEHHRAVYDARACRDIFFALRKRLETKEIGGDIQLSQELFPITAYFVAKSKKGRDALKQKTDGNEKAKTEEKIGKTGKIISLSAIVEFASKEEYESFSAGLTDAGIKEEKKESVAKIKDLSKLDSMCSFLPSYHETSKVTVLVKNKAGLKNLYRIISLAHTKYLVDSIPTITWDELSKNRDGLIFGTAGFEGLFDKMFEKGEKAFEMAFNAGIYDYFEIQPVDCYLGISSLPKRESHIIDCVKKIIAFAKSKNIQVVADSGAYYIKKSDKKYRDILIESNGVGGFVHPLKGKEYGYQHILSTTELISEMGRYVGKDEAKEMATSATERISDRIENEIEILKNDLFCPTDDFLKEKGIPSVKAEFTRLALEGLERYRDKKTGIIPEYVSARYDKEEKAIIGNGYAVIYYIAYLLVKKSNSDGYVVGSRGSVGSSFIAKLLGITEVNPLKPHYVCPSCGFSEFKGDKGPFSNELDAVSDGFDLPARKCPECGGDLCADGHDIPFETFLGFDGDKVPDIDLNFSGEYQWKAHNFCKEIFGADHAFRAGTISTIADKTAFSMTKSFLEKRGIPARNAEVERIAIHLEGTKRTTGQHPGGIIVIPANFDVLDFTPFQYPAEKADSDWFTTHFDFHAIHDNVLKLDILGHDDPTVLKFLMDKVTKSPEKFPFKTLQEIPLNDPDVYAYLRPNKTGAVEAYGIPEFGTGFVRGLLSETNPKTFSDLVKVSGLSHGTDVWNNNAQDLITGGKFKPVPFKNVIGCRDDIVIYLVSAGMKPKDAFDTMEFVRHGFGYKRPKEWPAVDEKMKEAGIPDWYRWSCERIQYLFPKAHATAYVMSALRIAWFKAHDPLDFYASFFTIRAPSFNPDVIFKGKDAIDAEIVRIESDKEATDLEKDSVAALEVASECFGRGFKIVPPDIAISEASEFVADEKNMRLVASFSSIPGLGVSAAEKIVAARSEKPYESREDFAERSGANKTVVAKLAAFGSFGPADPVPPPGI